MTAKIPVQDFLNQLSAQDSTGIPLTISLFSERAETEAEAQRNGRMDEKCAGATRPQTPRRIHRAVDVERSIVEIDVPAGIWPEGRRERTFDFEEPSDNGHKVSEF